MKKWAPFFHKSWGFSLTKNWWEFLNPVRCINLEDPTLVSSFDHEKNGEASDIFLHLFDETHQKK